MKAKYFVSVLKILKDKYGFNFNINDTMQQVEDKLDDVNTFRYTTKTNGSHLAANVIDFLKERDQKKRGDKWVIDLCTLKLIWFFIIHI